MARTKKIETVEDLLGDERNARRRTPRNLGMIEDSLREVGAARSIVINRKGQILAGNGTVEAAVNAGISKVRVVEADGNEIIAVLRDGLTPEQEKRLALYDNRTAELAEWDPLELTALRGEDLLDGLFYEDELDRLTITEDEKADDLGDEFPEAEAETETCCPKCGYRW